MARPFFSSALDETHTYSAIRYVERSSVDAVMVDKAEDYAWSSAAHQCGLIDNNALSSRANKTVDIPASKWAGWLTITENKAVTNILERNIEKGLPCGSDIFIGKLEQLTKISLRYRPQG